MRASEKIFLQKYYPHGAPPLPTSLSPGTVTELGILTQSPTVTLPAGTCHLDIGVQDDFIVFVRANTSQPAFTFTKVMWARINNGDYYMRACDETGQGLAYWHWTKTTLDGDC
jgi:hypothetical protein